MRISSVFYAIFHDTNGPQIVYQVPEDLITSPPRRTIEHTLSKNASSSSLNIPSTGNPNTPVIEVDPGSVPDLREPAPGDGKRLRRSDHGSKNRLNTSKSSRLNLSSSKNNSLSPNRSSVDGGLKTLFEWDLVSQFVIPRADMCGRLTISTTKKHRIVGFPVILRDPLEEIREKEMQDPVRAGADLQRGGMRDRRAEDGKEKKRYPRGTFQFNVCFVFEKDVDTRSYESIVRKIARVLTACEIDHQFLSSTATKDRIYSILEQLFTDLNAFSETSIRIDKFNWIELRIFPRYPNPPPVNAWDVPVPLIDIGNKDKMEGNWDLTMRKVVPFINGVDHVKKIAQKAEADIMLVKECMRQVMMYQCVMMIDIFQFSNLYTLCRPVMWLFTDPAVYEECGPYVHKGDGEPLPWPRLAWYYARLKPPLTVGHWIKLYQVDLEQLDVRRFITFGVIKGFLRRVHRWPILLKDDRVPLPASSNQLKRRTKSVNWPMPQKRGLGNELELNTTNLSLISEPPPILSSAVGVEHVDHGHRLAQEPPRLTREDTLRPAMPFGLGKGTNQKIGEVETRTRHPAAGGISSSIPDSYVSPSVLKARMGTVSSVGSSQPHDEEDPRAASLPIAQELAGQAYTQGHAVAKMKGGGGGGKAVDVPPELTDLLDGTHHSDELCVHFGLSWPVMHSMLSVIGGGSGDDDDLGRVAILYR